MTACAHAHDDGVKQPHTAADRRPTHRPARPPLTVVRQEPAVVLRAREAAIAVRMVRDGWTIREVADRLGVSPATAWRRYWWGEALAVLPDDAPLPTTRGVRPSVRNWHTWSAYRDPELFRLEPRPAVRCRAHRKSDRQRCGAMAVHGGKVCRMHGGLAPQVRRAADSRHSRAKATVMLARLQSKAWRWW